MRASTPARLGLLMAHSVDDLPRLQRPLFEQRAHDAPLLLGHPGGVQRRAEVRDHAFARLQQQQRQVAVAEDAVGVVRGGSSAMGVRIVSCGSAA
jgi:hypothetical protein